jgi:hypothetical protein
MYSTIIFGLALFFSLIYLEATAIDITNNENHYHYTKIIFGLGTVILWTWFYHLKH